MGCVSQIFVGFVKQIKVMFLYCPSLIAYWQRVMGKITDCLGININLKYQGGLCLLNSLKGNERISGGKAQWLKVLLKISSTEALGRRE